MLGQKGMEPEEEKLVLSTRGSSNGEDSSSCLQEMTQQRVWGASDPTRYQGT